MAEKNVDFETGDLSQFDSTQIDGGDFSASVDAVRVGIYGGKLLIDDANTIWGQLDFANKTRLRVGFYLDPNSLTMDDYDMFHLARDSGGAQFRVLFKRYPGEYRIYAAIFDDLAAWQFTGEVVVSDDWHWIEVDFKRSSADGADDGFIKLWVDPGSPFGGPDASALGLNDDTLDYDDFQIGACSGIDFPGTQGTFYIDEITINDTGDEIGPPEPEPPTPPPTPVPPTPGPTVTCTWAELVAAGQAPEVEPLARVTLRPNPYVTDQAMDWSLLGDFDGTGPLDGVTTNNYVLILVTADGKYKSIGNGQDTDQWNAAWDDFAVPGGCTDWGTDVEIFAIATDGTDVQVFARRTTAAWTIFANESGDDSETWDGWVAIGTSTYTNAAGNYVIGAAVLDTVFLRHYEDTGGICLEVFNNEGAVPWTRYELETNLSLEIPPPTGGCDVVRYGEIVYVYIGALHRDPAIYGYRIYLTTFYRGAWSSVDYLAMADVPDVVDSIESLFSFNIGALYGLTYDARDVVAPAIDWEDGFDSYGDYWLKIVDFENDETWVVDVGAWGVEAANYVEAAQAHKGTVQGFFPFQAAEHLVGSWDFTAEGRLGDDDYTYLAVYPHWDPAGGAAPNVYVYYLTPPGVGNYYYTHHQVGDGLTSDTWNFLKTKKSDMNIQGAPDWSNITEIWVRYAVTNGHVGDYCIFDDVRVVKADPGDTTTGNDTSVAWDFPSGEWHVYNEDDDAARTTLGQLDVEAGVEKFAIRHAWPVNDDYEIVVPIKAKRDDGLLGIAFRMTDTTAGSEDGYILVADTTNNLLRLYRMDAGVKTELDNGVFVFALDTWYHIGLRIIGSSIKGFAAATEAALFDTVLASDIDTTHTTGQVGVVSEDTVARFDWLAITAEMETELKKALHLASTPDVWPEPTLYEITGYTYPRERIVYQGDYWYAFDETDASFIVVQALSPIQQGADVAVPAETVTISLPLVQATATSAQADVTLSNVYGEFDDSPAYETGTELQIEGGYKWFCGEAYSYLFTGIVNRISENFHDNSMTIKALDYVYKLKKWASNKLRIFKSQFKIHLDLTQEDDSKHLVSIIEGFTYDSTNLRYRANVPEAENMALHGEYFNDVVVETKAYFVDSFTSAWFGIVLRSDSTGDNCYGVLWNKDADTIQIHKKAAGTWGAQVATAALNAYHSASLWIRAEIVNDTIYVFTSADGVVWTYRTSYADTSPLEEGHVGFVATPAASLAVDLREFTIYAFDTEKTVEGLMTQIATMAGVTTFLFEDEINDDFEGTDGADPSTLNWRVAEKTLTTADINTNRLRCISSNATWEYINSQVYRKTFVLDFKVNIPNDAEPACIVFRTNTTFTEGYRLEITPGAVATARITLVELDGGSTVADFYPRVAMTAATVLDFTLSVQDNFDETQTFVSLWMGGRLIFSCFDDSWPTAGYVGVGKYDDDTACYFDDFIIDKLDTPVVSRGQANYFVVNVGESAEKLIGELAAIQNARWFFNGAGAFTAGVLEPGTGIADVLNLDRTVITLYNALYVGSRERDDDAWISHVRVIANNAIYADVYDNDLLSTKGYRFHRLNINADLSAAQCQEIGVVFLEQQQKMGDTFNFNVTPAQFGLERRMRFHVHAHQIPRDPTSALKIDQDFIVGSQKITMKREPSPDWDMQISPEEGE